MDRLTEEHGQIVWGASPESWQQQARAFYGAKDSYARGWTCAECGTALPDSIYARWDHYATHNKAA